MYKLYHKFRVLFHEYYLGYDHLFRQLWLMFILAPNSILGSVYQYDECDTGEYFRVILVFLITYMFGPCGHLHCTIFWP